MPPTRLPALNTNSDPVLLTGATGFLGMELLARYLTRTDRQVIALVRARDDHAAGARLERVLELLFGRAPANRERLLALAGDVQAEGLGLSPSARGLVGDRVKQIVHCAATVSFTAGLEESRQINVEGTRRVLELARECAAHGELRDFAHVSTAYVAGEHGGTFREHDLDVGQRFRNPYERSKFEAEQLVRRHARELSSVTVLRPSIIVGESRTGWTPSFNVIYVPLRAFAERRLRALPADPSAPVDVVPVDHVADAIVEITRQRRHGLNTFHLVAGEEATTVGELVDMSARLLRRKPPTLISPRLYRRAHPLIVACARSRRRRTALRRSAPYLPYYTMRVRYSREQAARCLEPRGLRPPPLRSYYERLVAYATASEWGRRPLPRTAAVPSVDARGRHASAPR